MGYYEDQQQDPEPEIGSPEFWQAQAELPLREKDGIWWSGVAVPNAMLAVLIAGFVVLVVLSVLQILGYLG